MSSRAIVEDQDVIRSAFPEWHEVYSTLASPNFFRAMVDIMFDWLCIASAMFLLHKFGWWSSPAAIAWVGNRQRALGNLLHDAGHRNLSRTRKLNDTIACIFLAPPLFNGLAIYREQHARHHAWLGDRHADPDYISVRAQAGRTWWTPYRRVLLSRDVWLGSILGHLHTSRISGRQGLGILGWWIVAFTAISTWFGIHTAVAFACVWLIAKATVFHAITTFREMCDHFGRHPGGIFNFTRDVAASSAWRWVIHPRNNGYHLTHHLLPSVPYHRLGKAHRMLSERSVYARGARVCDAYFDGPNAVVREWEINPVT
ncbi:fatty acid desaturase [Paraburkholderia sediminicola]|uniref:fatty acid desaturase family protein n=1 Tax=Paraburkholderia sediminicola TaxID=458836 RepID=UPI0038BBE507